MLRRFTMHEYLQLYDRGVLERGDNTELLNGEIHELGRFSPLHSEVVSRVSAKLFELCGNEIKFRVRSPIPLNGISYVQPDIAIVRDRPNDYWLRHPRPEDVLLLIEVSDTMIEYDREVKLPHYANAGITELWLIDLVDHCIEQHYRPFRKEYGSRQLASPATKVQCHAVPQITLSLGEILADA
jgi:Uma2 family endonuclease